MPQVGINFFENFLCKSEDGWTMDGQQTMDGHRQWMDNRQWTDDRQWMDNGWRTCALCHLTMTSEDCKTSSFNLLYISMLADSLYQISTRTQDMISKYSSWGWWIDIIGSIEGAVNWELKCWLAQLNHQTRASCRSTCHVLQQLHKQFPDEFCWQNGDDTLLGVKHTFTN